MWKRLNDHMHACVTSVHLTIGRRRWINVNRRQVIWFWFLLQVIPDTDCVQQLLPRAVQVRVHRSLVAGAMAAAITCNNTIQYNAMRYDTIRCDAMQCNAMRCDAMQCNAMQCSAAQRSAVQCSAVQCSAVQYSTVQYSTVQYSTVQCNTIQYTCNRGLGSSYPLQ